jgi:hypothetical protein
MGRIARLLGLTLALGMIAVPAAHASTHFSVQVGVGPAVAPVAVAAPYPGYVWQPGHRVWTGYGYRWLPGRWVPAPNYGYYGRPYGYDGYRRDWYRDRWDRDRDRDRHWDRDWHR